MVVSKASQPLNVGLVYVVSFFAVAFLYSRFLFPNSADGSTLILVGAISTLLLHVIFSFFSPSRARMELSPLGRFSITMIGLAAVGALVSSYENITGDFDLKSAGTLFFVSLCPFLLIFSDRERMVVSICQIAVMFALADAIVNTLSSIGLYDLQVYSGRRDESGLRVRYPGLSGNTLGAGLVAFLAIAYLSSLAKKLTDRKLIFFLIAVLIYSLILIDARRYLGVSLIAILLIFKPTQIRIPYVFLIVGTVAIFLYGTFSADLMDSGNQLRAALMTYGWQQALGSPITGIGVSYTDQTDLVPTFESLASAGVVESQTIEFMRDFGIVSTVLWMIGIFAVSFREQQNKALAGVLFALIAAEVFYGTPLRGPLASIIFYSCYITLISQKASSQFATKDPEASLVVEK